MNKSTDLEKKISTLLNLFENKPPALALDFDGVISELKSDPRPELQLREKIKIKNAFFEFINLAKISLIFIILPRRFQLGLIDLRPRPWVYVYKRQNHSWLVEFPFYKPSRV